MLYLYGIIDTLAPAFALPCGFSGESVEVVACGEVGAVVCDISSEPVRNAQNAHLHMDVLTALMPHCAVLPSQFGVVFPSRDELLAAVERLSATLLADLRRLSGQIEVNVKVTDRSPLLGKPVCEGALTADTSTVAADSGASAEVIAPSEEPALRYVTTKGADVKARALQTRGNELLAETVQAPFATVVTAKVWRAVPSASGRPQITASFLLPREQLDAFQDGVKTLKEADPRLDVRMTGPWPPFSFVSDESTVKSTGAVTGAE